MNRDEHVQRMEDHGGRWDVAIIGGGATGLGIAIESASRGYSTLLLEQHDFAKGTSSRSTKLIHGGVRYLRQGNVRLVLEALRERERLLRNAPHLVSNLGFVVPCYDWWEGPFYGAGLRVYDWLAGRSGFGPSTTLSREETLAYLPTLEQKGLHGGRLYYDGQFDDTRLAINMAQTAVDLGAVVINYMRVVALEKQHALVSGLVAQDMETGQEYALQASVVINATGIFTDAIRQMDDPAATPIIRPSQGIHIVLDRTFLPGDTAIMVPRTDDGRVLFAIPWHERTLVGTTDTPVDHPEIEPRPFAQEVDYLLTHIARYLVRDPEPQDVLSMFAGQRPLVRTSSAEHTSSISREHTLLIARSGLVTITGGKWTTYRQMAEETIDQAAIVAQLCERPSITKDLRLHGWHSAPHTLGSLACYGADAPAIAALMQEHSSLRQQIHTRLPYYSGEVVWAARHEMARTIEDILARRTRALLLDATASVEAAPLVAELLAQELGNDAAWIAEQVRKYRTLAAGYMPSMVKGAQ